MQLMKLTSSSFNLHEQKKKSELEPTVGLFSEVFSLLPGAIIRDGDRNEMPF